MAATEITPLLGDIARVLRASGENEWAAAFESLESRSRRVPDEERGAFFREVLAIYSGMGSFNDVVLHHEGKPLSPANDRLSLLRAKLFETAMNAL